MQLIPEAETAALVTPELAFVAARRALIAAAEDGVVFPAVLGHGHDPANRFSIKSGVMAGGAGLKVGAYWPGAARLGLTRHASTVLLIDEATGRVRYVIETSAANALRTAAADAVAASVLARRDAKTLAVFGAGSQAFHEVTALAAVRPLRQVFIVARQPAAAQALAARLAERGVRAAAAEARAACEAADMIVTATAARAPLFEADWVRPGAYLAAMGADAPGKQEVPPALLRRASLFCDLPAQSVAIGELQSVAADIAEGRLALTALGEVLAGRAAGRVSADEITVFDSSGIALQDIALALEILASRAAAS